MLSGLFSFDRFTEAIVFLFQLLLSFSIQLSTREAYDLFLKSSVFVLHAVKSFSLAAVTHDFLSRVQDPGFL